MRHATGPIFLMLLATACGDEATTGQAENPVVISFSGTVTRVLDEGADPPSDVTAGTPVSGTFSYLPGTARRFTYRPSFQAYDFYSHAENVIDVAVGDTTWSIPLDGITVCDDSCGGDEFICYFTASAVPYVILSYLDHTPPYDLVVDDALPHSHDDIDFSVALSGSGKLWADSQGGRWYCEYSLDSTSVRALPPVGKIGPVSPL